MEELPAEIEKAKSITLFSGEIIGYKNFINTEDIKFRKGIQLQNVVLGINGKRALSIL